MYHDKKDFIAVIAEKTGVSKKNAECVYDAIIEEIKNELAAKGKVSIAGFGSFELRERSGHTEVIFKVASVQGLA